MPEFRYIAVNADGKLHRGVITAQSHGDALTKLDEKGLWTLDLFGDDRMSVHRFSFDLQNLAARFDCMAVLFIFQLGI